MYSKLVVAINAGLFRLGSELHLSHEERVAKGASAAHVLAYAVMILNTDLHNSNVQCSMSLKDFKKNCRR